MAMSVWLCVCALLAAGAFADGEEQQPEVCSVGSVVTMDDRAANVVAIGWRNRNSYPNIQYAGGFKSSAENPHIFADFMVTSSNFKLLPGSYQVSVYWPASDGRGSRTPHIVTHDQGMRRVMVNQKLQPYNLSTTVIGTFSFGAFPGQKVRIEAVPHENTAADAMQFLCVGPPSTAPVVRPTPPRGVVATTTPHREPQVDPSAPTEPANQANAQPHTDFSNPVNNNGSACVPNARYTLDNGDEAVVSSPAWVLKTASHAAFRNTFLSSENLPDVKAFYRVNGLPYGRYRVFVYFVASSTRAKTAPHYVIHDGGYNRFEVNQRVQPETLLSIELGEFSFGGGPDQGVRIQGVVGEKVVADAVSFVCVPPA